MGGKNLLVSNEAHKALKLYCTEHEFGMSNFASIAIIEYIAFCKIKEADIKNGKK